MTWQALDLRCAAAERDAVASWLVARTGQAVEERGSDFLVAFAPDEEEARVLLGELRQVFPAATVTVREVATVDWVERWREGLGPRRIGRLTVTPSWVVPDPADLFTVVVDPETAFGSGEHGSTRSALTLLDRHLYPGDTVIDLGSGSGILAIAAARLGAVRATGIEVDPEAEPVATANAERNGVSGRVTFVTGDAAVLVQLAGPADLVLANIRPSVNVALLPAIRRALRPEGLAIFAGMETGERDLFLTALDEAAFDPCDEATDEGWWAVAAERV